MRRRYVPWKIIRNEHRTHINTYHSTQNLALNLNLKSKLDLATHSREKKNGFKIFAWANLQNFCITESEIKFQVIWCVYFICYESYMSHRAVLQKMIHSSLLLNAIKFWKSEFTRISKIRTKIQCWQVKLILISQSWVILSHHFLNFNFRPVIVTLPFVGGHWIFYVSVDSMSFFRWACQIKYSEGLQNLGFIFVAPFNKEKSIIILWLFLIRRRCYYFSRFKVIKKTISWYRQTSIVKLITTN